MSSTKTQPDFTTVTETAGDKVSGEQIERMFTRYRWACEYVVDKDVVEVACGTGQGLGYLARTARSVEGGDISAKMVATARAYYADRLKVEEMDASCLPYPDASKNVILLFEALYYLPSAEQFVRECRRVLRPNGKLLIVSANKDLFDFNPSPYSHVYYGVMELKKLIGDYGFSTKFFGGVPLTSVSLKQRLLRPVKKAVVTLNLMPSTMAGKKLLKRLVFGRLSAMPKEVMPDMAAYQPPSPIPDDRPDRQHKVIFCEATVRRLG